MGGGGEKSSLAAKATDKKGATGADKDSPTGKTLEPLSATARARSLAVVYSTVILNGVGEAMVQPLLARVALSYGKGPSFIGILSSVFFLAKFLSTLIMGPIQDRFGYRLAFFICVAGFTSGQAFSGLAPSIIIFIAARGYIGLMTGASALAQGYIVRSSSREQMATRLSYTGAGKAFGFVVGPMVGASLQVVSIAMPFFASAGLGAAVLTAAVLFLREPQAPPKTPGGSRKQLAVDPAAAPHGHPAGPKAGGGDNANGGAGAKAAALALGGGGRSAAAAKASALTSSLKGAAAHPQASAAVAAVTSQGGSGGGGVGGWAGGRIEGEAGGDVEAPLVDHAGLPLGPSADSEGRFRRTSSGGWRKVASYQRAQSFANRAGKLADIKRAAKEGMMQFNDLDDHFEPGVRTLLALGKLYP